MNDKLILATNNENKVAEIKSILGDLFEVITLKQAGINIDIPEPFDTLEDNAAIKSRTIFELTGSSCFSEDTGLFVDVLHGEPGVKSARYAGEPASNKANIQKLLFKMQQMQNRLARFRTVISLILNKEEYQFEGICEGTILEAPVGEHGFGYDAVFVPYGSQKSFAQMEMEEKNKYSHRKKAITKLVNFLSNDSDATDKN
jgi:XTP/dITP diphosphohydrolase